MPLFNLIIIGAQIIAPIIVFFLDKKDYLQSFIYPIIRQNLVPKNDTARLLICSTPSVYERNV